MSFIIASQLEQRFNDGLARHPAGPSIIPVPEETPWSVADAADVLLVRPSPAWRGRRQSPRPPGWPGRLRWVYSASVGVDFYPSWLLEAPLVTCGRGVASDEIADYAIAAIYAEAKQIDRVAVSRAEDWQIGGVRLGRVSGATLGLVGLGAIGIATAERALALGMKVVAARRGAAPSPVAGVELADTLATVFERADHIVLAIPSTSETRGLIDRDLLFRARPGAHIINVARGAVLDQEALIDALDHGPLSFATLDVTEPEPLPAGHPLYTHPKVRLTPHVSSNYLAVRERLYDKITRDLTLFACGEPPSDIVDPLLGY